MVETYHVILRDEPTVHNGRGSTSGATSGETMRLLALRNLQILDSGREAQFDDIARLAATVCRVPTAFVTFVDRSRVWFKASIGYNPVEVDRATSFCSPAIDQSEPIFEIPDAFCDPSFAQAPNVIGPPFIRFYAGVPLVVEGAALGTLCVTDVVPRSLTSEQRETLLVLARQIVTLLQYRTTARQLAEAHRTRDEVEAELSIFGKAVNRAVNGLLFFGKRSRAGESTVWFVNEYFCNAIGRDASHLIGKPIGEIVTHHADQAGVTRLRAILAAGVCQNEPITFQLPGEPRREFEMSISIIDRVNQEQIYLVVLHDTTERQAAAAALRERHVVETRNEVLIRSETRLRELFAGTPAILYTLDRNLRFLSSLGGGLRSIGLRPDQAVGMLLSELAPDKEFDATLHYHERALAGESISFENDIFGRPFRTFLEPLRDADDRPCGVSGIAFDLSEVARAERRGKTGSWSQDAGRSDPTYSLEAQRLFGLSSEHTRDDYYARIIAEDREHVLEEMRIVREQGLTRRFEFRLAGDTTRYVFAIAEAFRNGAGDIVRFGGVFLDITERRSAQLEAAQVAATDAVTGLANRSAFMKFLRECDSSADVRHCFILDVHRFHFINEAFGRDLADGVLAAIAARLRAIAGNSFVARLESDTFALVCPGTADAFAHVGRIHEAFADSFEVGDRRVSLALAIGISSIRPGATVEGAVFEAELAISTAKKLGPNRFVFFTPELAAAAHRHSVLDRDIQQAIERNELEVHYQPIVDACGKVVTLEALLRWSHPVLGAIGPDEFIAVAEENGTILPIGRWVITTACDRIRVVRNVSSQPLRVAVNVSAKQFMDADLFGFIEQELLRCELPPEALEIEITESTLARDPADAIDLLARLRRLGVTVSVDDFGTGYSSLSSLRHLPIDNVKIDRSFVAGTPANSEACAIVETILGLASKLSLSVIAEGVETEQQERYLRSHGCDMLQGYRYSRPLSAGALLAYVEKSDR